MIYVYRICASTPTKFNFSGKNSQDSQNMGFLWKVPLRREDDLPTRSQVGLSLTWIEIARGALCSQVLRSWGAAKAEENLTAKWTKCNFIPMSTRWQPSSPSRRRGLLGCLRVDIGTKSVSHPPCSVILFVSTPGPSCFEKLVLLQTLFMWSFLNFYCRARLFWFLWFNCFRGTKPAKLAFKFRC